MLYTCPKDATHASDDPDYCSVCGAKIGGGIAVAPLLSGTGASTADTCPDCGLPRPAGAKFCEVCRYNFETHASASPAASSPPGVSPVPEPLPVPAVVPPAVPLPGASRLWEAVVTVDPLLYVEPDPQVPCPTNEPERTFPVDLAESLIGRRSDRRDIHPEVPLSDGGVSHRHAKLLLQSDGGLALLDLGSTNGTLLNGTAVPAGVRMPLQDGDQVTLGCWTRITVRVTQKV